MTIKKQAVLWAHTHPNSKIWGGPLVSCTFDKPRKTKKVPWFHTKDGSCCFFEPEQWTALTGRKLPAKGKLVRVRLEVIP